ncbi:hypothetical protein [Symmachiella macrocystis]|nr:hypothetical protein [Symmachiella macrocystis]
MTKFSSAKNCLAGLSGEIMVASSGRDLKLVSFQANRALRARM